MRPSFRNPLRATFAIAIAAALQASPAAAQLQAYAYSVGGETTSPTVGPTDHMRYDYPGGQSGKYYVLTPGPGYGAQESSQYFTASGGTVSAASTMSAGGMGPSHGDTYVGNSQSHAAYGRLGVGASGTFSGQGDAGSTSGSEAFATFTESFTIAGQAGQTGYFVPTFTVDGDWSKSGKAATQFQLDYRVNGGPTYMAYRIQGDLDHAPELYLQGEGTVQSIPGITTTDTTASGSAQVSLSKIAFQYDQAFDLTIALYASVLTYPHGSGSVDFLHTATLSGISILDAQGNPVGAFSIAAGSGTHYDANGVQAVPVPAAAWLFGSALVGLIGAPRRQQRH